MRRFLFVVLLTCALLFTTAGACGDCDSPVAVGSDAYCNEATDPTATPEG